MKLFIVFFLAFSLSLSTQSYNKKEIFVATDACKTSMSKEVITNDKLIFKCANFINGGDFTIEDFKLKIPNHATIHIVGSSLSEKAKRLIKNSKEPINIAVFDIKKISSNSKIVENTLRGLTISIKD